jgi:hypothetical protein
MDLYGPTQRCSLSPDRRKRRPPLIGRSGLASQTPLCFPFSNFNRHSGSAWGTPIYCLQVVYDVSIALPKGKQRETKGNKGKHGKQKFPAGI